MTDNNRDKKKSKFALGALLGAAAGAITGLLFAPKSGEETRADLKRKANELESEAKEKAGAAKSKATETAQEVKETGQRLGRKAKGVAKAGKEALDADTELGSKLKQKEARMRAKDLKEDVENSARKNS